MAKIQRISNNKKRKIQELVNFAKQAFSSGSIQACERVCMQIERLQQGNPDAANLRGILAARAEQFPQAEEYFVQAINAAPKRADFCRNLGSLFSSQKMQKDAAELYQRAYHLEPDNREGILGLANALSYMDGLDRARELLESARKCWPDDEDVLQGLYFVYYKLNLFDLAGECIDRILQKNPEHKQALLAKAHLKLAGGDVAEAEAIARKVLEHDPENIQASIGMGVLKKFTDPEDADIVTLKSTYESTEAGSGQRVSLCFTLARVMEGIGNYDEAFSYLREGNDIEHALKHYDSNAELEHLQEIMRHYTPEVLQKNSGIEDETPVFILGMPRCGSTLTEQILAAHHQVSSRGECCFFETELEKMHSPDSPLTLERMAALDSQQWQTIGEGFLEQLKEGSPNALRITDKTLPNFRFIGAIHCALPKAKIIHVRRNPIDNCLAIYKVNLGGKLHDYGYTLGGLGYYYRMYQRLMQHWREVLPEGVMYELDYEKLVTNQEEETRKLLAYCGLPWDDACLQFDKVKNVVQTASIAQVRRGIYTDAVARWKRYEKHLQPLIRILGVE